MSQHTPGPWSYSMDDESNYARIYLHGLGRIDKIKGGDSLCGYCGEANARLIAAAPELLEAVRGFMRWLDSDISLQEARVKARAAIAKAEGKA